jgi:hypothetical protein
MIQQLAAYSAVIELNRKFWNIGCFVLSLTENEFLF